MTATYLQYLHLRCATDRRLSSGLAPTPIAFLKSWFLGCPPDQLFELRAIRSGDHFVEQEFFTMDAMPALYWRACEMVEEFDIYFGPLPPNPPPGRQG